MSDAIDAPGTVVFEVVQALRNRFTASAGQTTEISHVRLAQVTGRSKRSLAELLVPAHAAGILMKTERANTLFWSLGPNVTAARDDPVPVDSESEARKVMKVDANVAISVFAYAQQRVCDDFSVSMHTDGRMGIERNGRLICELNNAERLKVLAAAASGVMVP